MLKSQKLLIKQLQVDLISDVIPIDMLPYLLCLTDADCEQIRFKQDREGPIATVPTLLDKLKKRPGAFEQFLTALGETGCSHLKTLLQNAVTDQTHHPEPEHNSNMMTPETISNGSENLKTPTSETVSPETKQSLKSTTSKKSNKRPKKLKIPRENTTSPPTIKSHSVSTNKTSPPTSVKLVKATKDRSNTPPKKSNVSSGKTKEVSTTTATCTQASGIINPPSNSHPSKTDFNIENSKTKYDTLVCYAKENRKIALELKTFLETECQLEVCIDLCNFIPGKAITDNICESINSSRSIVFLLSREFLGKLWASWELKNAVYDFNASQKHGKCKKIIPVLLEECTVPEELKIYTEIKMEEFDSRKDCWGKIAAAVLGREHIYVCDDDDVDDDIDDGSEDVGDSTNGVDNGNGDKGGSGDEVHSSEDGDHDDQNDYHGVDHGHDDSDDDDHSSTGDDNDGVDDKDACDNAAHCSNHDDCDHDDGNDCVDDSQDGGDHPDIDVGPGDDAVGPGDAAVDDDNIKDKGGDLHYDNRDDSSESGDSSDDVDNDDKNNDDADENKADADNENKTDATCNNIKSL